MMMMIVDILGPQCCLNCMVCCFRHSNHDELPAANRAREFLVTRRPTLPYKFLVVCTCCFFLLCVYCVLGCSKCVEVFQCHRLISTGEERYPNRENQIIKKEGLDLFCQIVMIEIFWHININMIRKSIFFI